MLNKTATLQAWLILLVPLLSVFGCGTSHDDGSGDASQTVIVTITDYSGMRVSDATVVLGDSNGTMKASGLSDSNGQITFTNAPENATITAANTCLWSGSTTTTYSINIQYDVNGSVVLPVDNCSATGFSIPAGSDAPLGTVTVNVTNTPSNVVKNQIAVGWQVFLSPQGSVITSQTITIRESDLNSNGKLSITVIGRDSSNKSVAYGAFLDKTFIDGMTADISMEPMSFVEYQIVNIPATAIRLQPTLIFYSAAHKGNFGSADSYSLTSVPSSTTISMAYIPGFGERIDYQLNVELDRDHNGKTDSRQSVTLTSNNGSPVNQMFDISKALPAPYVTVAGADTATPTLSWSGIDPAATSIYAGVIITTPASQFYLGFSTLVRSRTSIKYPELPDSLAAFRPNKVNYFSVSVSGKEGNLWKRSSGHYSAF